MVVRVARRPGVKIGELRGHGFADDHGTGSAQPGDDGGVTPGPASGGERGAKLGRIIRGVDDILDRDRNAVQRAKRVAQRAALVERACLRQHVLAVEMNERPDLAVERLDAGEAGAGIVLGRNRPAGDFRGGVGRGQRHKPVAGHGFTPALSAGLGRHLMAGLAMAKRRWSRLAARAPLPAAPQPP